MSEGGDEKGFLSARQVAAYGCFDGAPSGEELERFFFLDDEDRKLIAKRRGDANRLGFALQLTTVRFLGTFLDDPLDVPSVVLDELAAQLGIADASCVKTYVEGSVALAGGRHTRRRRCPIQMARMSSAKTAGSRCLGSTCRPSS